MELFINMLLKNVATLKTLKLKLKKFLQMQDTFPKNDWSYTKKS